MRDFDPEMMEKESIYLERKRREIHPKMLDELMFMSMERGGSDMSLLLLAGMVRETMPWMAEILVETRREIKTATSDEARKTRTMSRRP